MSIFIYVYMYIFILYIYTYIYIILFFQGMFSEDLLDPVSMLFLVLLFIFLNNIKVYWLLLVWVHWRSDDALIKAFLLLETHLKYVSFII